MELVALALDSIVPELKIKTVMVRGGRVEIKG